MDSVAHDLISLLEYLLPGFVTAWIFHSLTSYAKSTQFERIVQALIFTLLIQVTVTILSVILVEISGVMGIYFWRDALTPLFSIVFAVLFGLLFARLANTDHLHEWLRLWNITRETSFPSEWFGAFLKPTFVVLHLKDERRLYGWPKEWPSDPGKGHFQIINPSWVHDGDEQPISGVQAILISVDDVRWVEFMTETWESGNVEEAVESSTTAVAP